MMRDKIKKGTVNENKEENKKQNKIKILHMNKYFRLSLIVFLSLALPVLGCFMYIREKYKYIDQKFMHIHIQIKHVSIMRYF